MFANISNRYSISRYQKKIWTTFGYSLCIGFRSLKTFVLKNGFALCVGSFHCNIALSHSVVSVYYFDLDHWAKIALPNTVDEFQCRSPPKTLCLVSVTAFSTHPCPLSSPVLLVVAFPPLPFPIILHRFDIHLRFYYPFKRQYVLSKNM